MKDPGSAAEECFKGQVPDKDYLECLYKTYSSHGFRQTVYNLQYQSAWTRRLRSSHHLMSRFALSYLLAPSPSRSSDQLRFRRLGVPAKQLKCSNSTGIKGHLHPKHCHDALHSPELMMYCIYICIYICMYKYMYSILLQLRATLEGHSNREGRASPSTCLVAFEVEGGARIQLWGAPLRAPVSEEWL